MDQSESWAPENSNLAMRSVAAAGETPSPSPTRRRQKRRPGMKEATHGTAAVAKDHINTPARKTVLQVLHSQSLFTELNLNYVIFFCRHRSVKNDCIFLVQWERELCLPAQALMCCL
jgi:hypothetical protein